MGKANISSLAMSNGGDTMRSYDRDGTMGSIVEKDDVGTMKSFDRISYRGTMGSFVENGTMSSVVVKEEDESSGKNVMFADEDEDSGKILK